MTLSLADVASRAQLPGGVKEAEKLLCEMVSYRSRFLSLFTPKTHRVIIHSVFSKRPEISTE